MLQGFLPFGVLSVGEKFDAFFWLFSTFFRYRHQAQFLLQNRHIRIKKYILVFEKMLKSIQLSRWMEDGCRGTFIDCIQQPIKVKVTT